MMKIAIPLLLGLGLGLAVLIAPRLSTDAGAVLAGVAEKPPDCPSSDLHNTLS